MLVEALPYLKEFRGRTVVVKLGGAAIEPGGDLGDVLHSIVFLSYAGIRPVVVHGGGPYITRAMEEAGIEAVFVRGQRVTDAESLAIVERVLIHQVNARLVAAIDRLGGQAVGLHSRNGKPLLAEKLYGAAEDGSPVDLGFVGRVAAVRTAVVHEVLDVGSIPVIAPLGTAPDGQTLNCNADGVAWKVAADLGAEKLVLLSDVPGVLRDRQDPASLLSTITQEEAEQLEREGVIDGGMVPKVQACLRAVEAGVRKAHMIDGRVCHALLLEIFTDQGVGTEIIRSRPAAAEARPGS